MRIALTVILIASAATTLRACKVPVFRYALERWEADDYRALVTYRGATQRPAVMPLVERLRRAKGANLEVDVLDLEAPTEEQLWQYDDLHETGDEPLLHLYYPHRAKIDAPFWQGPLTPDNVSLTLHSPLRQQIVEAILQGASTVWLLGHPGDPEELGEAEVHLEKLLRHAAETIAIPDGVVLPEHVPAQAIAPDGQPLEMDDVLRTPIPLRIEFPILRFSLAEPREQIIVAALRGLDPLPSRLSPDEVRAWPVFGRGRVLRGIPVSKMDAASIGGACAYLCGACSCQVKDENPGFDLLFNAGWARSLGDAFGTMERPLPALSGFGAGIAPPEAAAAAAPAHGRGGHIRVPALAAFTLGGLLGAVLIGTYLMRRRQSG